MEFNVLALLTILAGGILGGVLAQYLCRAPNWVLWVASLVVFVLALYVVTTLNFHVIVEIITEV